MSHGIARLRPFAVATAFAASTLAASTASAQPSSFPGLTGPAGGRGEVANSPESQEAPTQSKRSVRLFDQRRSRAAYELDIGPVWVRKVEDETATEKRSNVDRKLGEVAFGTAFITPQKPFFLTGVQKTLLRVYDSKTFSWSVFVQELGGGLMLGPVEPEVRMGLSLLTLDVFRGEWSAQLLSPRVSAGFGFAVGKIRLDIKAHTEYLWRWFGPDYLSQGITLGIRLDIPRPKSPFVEARQ